MGFPKYVKIYTAQFYDVGESTENLRVSWNYPDYPNNPGNHSFLVGTEIFLESPVNCSQVPDEQLMASLSMSAILSGALPGTSEFFDAVTVQDTKNFQTIIGDVKLKQNPTPVIDQSIGPDGTVYDILFCKAAQVSNTKTVRTDAWNLSQYSNRVDSGAHAVYCVAGALHKEFGFKKSQLGAAGSANRQAVIDFVAGRYFWV